MESVYYTIGIIVGQLGLVALVTWFVIQLRAGPKEDDAKRRLAVLERQEEEMKKAA